MASNCDLQLEIRFTTRLPFQSFSGQNWEDDAATVQLSKGMLKSIESTRSIILSAEPTEIRCKRKVKCLLLPPHVFSFPFVKWAVLSLRKIIAE